MNNKGKIYVYDEMVLMLVEQEKYEDALELISKAIRLIQIIPEWSLTDKNIAHFYFKNLAKKLPFKIIIR